MSTVYVLQAILLLAAITFLLRAVPFFMPKCLLEHPLFRDMANFMPLVVMVILVLSAFENASFFSHQKQIAIIAGIGMVVTFHLWFRNTLLSILSGVFIHIVILNA